MWRNTDKSLKLFLLVWFVLLFLHYPAQAATINGGSTLLDMTKANQLQTWLGEGEIILTNIFSTTPSDGKTSSNFHSAVDLQGRTFSVLSITSTNYTTPILFGGYNPQSWDGTLNQYVTTASDTDRTAFLFNLNDTYKWNQKLSTDPLGSNGFYQTYNGSGYGPTFGGGHDLYVNNNLQFDYNYPWGYGPHTTTGFDLDGITGLSNNETNPENWATTLEVFTISAVPIPSAVWLFGSGLIGLAGIRRRFRS